MTIFNLFISRRTVNEQLFIVKEISQFIRKTILLIVFLSCSNYISGQIENKPDYNFGFEKTGNKNELRAYMKMQNIEDGAIGLMLRIDGENDLNNPITSSNHLDTADYNTLEKVYLHTDRDCYYPGEDIWFKAYLIDATDRFLSDNSNNLHVELISPSSDIIDSRIVSVYGLGKGDFHLADILPTGQYRIRAYTNYMRNFSDQLFYNKIITIINPAVAGSTLSDSTGYITDKLEINFFPEGGALVDSVPSVVAFKAVNAFGAGIDVSSEVFSSTGETITAFKSAHKGMGTFSLQPLQGLNYYVIARDESGSEVRKEIPKSFSTGIVLSISKNQSREISILLETNSQTLPLFIDKDISLTVSARNKPFKTYNFRIKTLNNFFILPTDDIPDGIVMLTLSGPENIPLCERLVFIQKDEAVQVRVKTDKTIYNQRDSVSLKISFSDTSDITRYAFLSLSATKTIFADNSSLFPSTISSWFLLESDVRGEVEEPSYYFDPSNPGRVKDLDLLLLTQGWRDFKWKYGNIKYLPENGFKISGRLRKLFSDVPLVNSKVNLAIFKSGNPLIEIVPTDSSGRFSLEGIELTGDAKLIASATGNKGKSQGWILLDSVNYAPATLRDNVDNKRILLTDNKLLTVNQPANYNQRKINNLNKYIQYAEIKTSIHKKYKLTDTINIGEVTITAKRQDSPKESIAHSNLRTLFAEREMKITPQEEKYGNVSQLMNAKLNNISISGVRVGKKALILLDGMEVEYDGIAALPVSMIERVDILGYIEGYRLFGERGGAGVMSFTSKNDWGSTSINLHSVNIKFSGYNEPRIFYSPKHYTTLESDYKPDLRTTLFWEPNITLQNNKDLFLNYFNADNPSSVKIIVEGITSAGIPVSGEAEYEVK